MNLDPEHAIREIYQAAVDAVKPRAVLRRALRREGDVLVAGGEQYDLASKPVYVFAVGKAAGGMLAEVEALLGDALTHGLGITKAVSDDLRLRSLVLAGSHPVPDQRSMEAGAAALQFAREISDGALVICLISGGGSALMESLRPGVSLEDLQRITRELLRAGASIDEVNAVRARLSAIKAGGLLADFGDVDVVNVVISDVLSDDLATIASGPTVPMQGLEPAEDVLTRYGLEFDLPDVAVPRASARPNTIISGNLSGAIDAAAAQAGAMGLEPVVLARSLTGEARYVGSTIAAILADSRARLTAFGRGTCLIAGGETTVTVQGDGLGGRNTEAALAAAIRLRGVEGVAVGFLASDGDDAETGAAGGIVTGETVAEDDLATARKALAENDSYTWLAQAGAAWGQGPTGTNVNDLVIGIVS